MNIIEMTRNLGKELQKSDEFIAMQLATQAYEEDTRLQNAIGEFNLKKLAINNEAQKEERNEDLIKQMSEDFRKIYTEIINDDTMTKYNEAKSNMDALASQVTGILNLCVQGEDPDTCVVDTESCGGDCSGCAGCN